MSHKFESRANCLARLEVLSYTAPAGMTLQLPCMLHTCASFSDLPTASQSRGPACVCTLKLFFTLSHTLPLHDSHLNTRFLNVELQANWHGIKPIKWLIKFNLTNTVHKTRLSDCSLDVSMLFSHGRVLHLKRVVKLNGSQVSRSDHTVRSGFNNLAYKDKEPKQK